MSLIKDTTIPANKIAIAFCINNAYAQHMAVTIVSILANNPFESFTFHVLHFDIDQQTERKIRALELKYPNHNIVFHKIDPSFYAGLEVPKELAHITKETYLRFFIPDLLAENSRAIYMDIDMICTGNLRALWEYDLDGLPLSAVPEDCDSIGRRTRLGLTPEGTYYCAGLLVMDLNKLRKEGATQELCNIVKTRMHQISFADQDAINILFDGRIAPLSPIYGNTKAYNPFRRDIRLWHFQCQTRKPWCNIWKNGTWPIYLKYLLMSPYRHNALRFIIGHLKGFFFFKYTKKCTTRYLVCGIRVWRDKTINK